MSHPPPTPPPPPWPVPQPPPPRKVSAGAVVGGAFIVPGWSFFAFLFSGLLEGSTGAGYALLVAIPVFVIGGLLAVPSNGTIARGLGLGMLVGWAVLGIMSAGFCTGLNPSFY